MADASPQSVAQRQLMERIHSRPVQRQGTTKNDTGLPDSLKPGIERLSAMSMDDVRVHYNSAKPADVQALAYTQGSHIHVGPGQERHVAHEAWHVVQQKQGRVHPTMHAGGIAINDDVGLEREADVMGAKASQASHADRSLSVTGPAPTISPGVLQGMWPFDGPTILSREFWQGGDGGATPEPVPEAKEPRRQTNRELRARDARESKARNKKINAERAQRLSNLPKELHGRLVAAEVIASKAAQALPDEILVPWTADEPALVEALLYPTVAALPKTVFRSDYAADTAEQRTVELEIVAGSYRDYCTAIGPHLTEPALYKKTYVAVLPVGLVQQFADACLLVEQGIELQAAIARFEKFLSGAKAHTALDSDGLASLPLPAARLQVATFFELGRLSIGKHRKFYPTDFDKAAGKFGGEWALVAGDASLEKIAESWVFHAHCQAAGDPAMQDYSGFAIVRGLGASHIKRESDRMATGASITVHQPGEFDRLERDTAKRFEVWSGTPEGIHALRRKKRQ